MAEIEYEVHPLFAEPLFRANISHAISDKQVEIIKNLKMVQNKSNLISEDLYIFNHKELKSIKNAVQKALDIYAKTVMGISQKLYPTQSWSLINQPNMGMHGHSHSNSIVSGALYYTDMPKPVASMIFDRHTTYQQLQLTPDNDKKNIYNTTMNVVTPKKGELIMFSSRLQHFVQANMSKDTRYSVSFNSFIKGKLGDLRDVNELRLS
ncbi:TIGR02466 family protein [Hellea balneolensis]|uniref:TIGR02466 family protein n=1 Tax=Hellea balneolensis TaxID=287478 RepID=UPI000412E0FF|nr:TIGR02466 family protein [Hellea balneolensis]